MIADRPARGRRAIRDVSVIVLIENTSPTQAAGRQRIAAIEQQLQRDRNVQSVIGYLETKSRDFVSKRRQHDLSRRSA